MKQAPRKTPSPRQIAGKKKLKERLTFSACTNSNETGSLATLVIVTAKKPRYFERKTGKEYGSDSQDNEKAWMSKYSVAPKKV